MNIDTNNKPSVPGTTPVAIEVMTRNILLLHFKQGMSVSSIATIFSLSHEEVEEKISNFSQQFTNRTYLMNVINGLANMNIRNAKVESVSETEVDKDREIALLKQRLKDAEIRAEAYEEMVRLAETTYGIKIRKKYGAK